MENTTVGQTGLPPQGSTAIPDYNNTIVSPTHVPDGGRAWANTMKKFSLLVLMLCFALSMQTANAQCSAYSSEIISPTDSRITASNNVDNCPAGTCASYCGFNPGELRIGATNPHTGYIDVTASAASDNVKITIAALSYLPSSNIAEYVVIYVDGTRIDLTSASATVTPLTGGTNGVAYVSTAGNNYSGLVGVLESTGTSGCAEISLDLDCTVQAGSVVRVENVQIGSAAAHGIYASLAFCTDTPTTSGTCGCDPNDANADCDNDGVLNGVDCDPADAAVTTAVGDACDAGTGAGSGTLNASCNCVANAINAQSCTDGVQVLANYNETATGAGSSGIPDMSAFNIPAGNNRAILVISAFEREHCQGGDNCTIFNTSGFGLSDNFVAQNFSTLVPEVTLRFQGSGGQVDKSNLGTDLGAYTFQATYTNNRNAVNTIVYSREMYFHAIYESDISSMLGGATSGNIALSWQDINLPIDGADEAMVSVYIFSNVEQTSSGIVGSSENVLDRQPFMTSNSDYPGNYDLPDTDFVDGREPDEVNDGLLIVGMNGLGDYSFNALSGYTTLHDVNISNVGGNFTAFNEGDGFSYRSQFRNGPSSGIIDNVTLQSSAPSNVASNGGILYGFTIESCECDPNDATADCDNDGVLNGVDCDPADASVTTAIGDACDAGTGAGSGTLDASCACVASCNAGTAAPQFRNN